MSPAGVGTPSPFGVSFEDLAQMVKAKLVEDGYGGIPGPQGAPGLPGDSALLNIPDTFNAAVTINAAIDAAATAGGGLVELPPGMLLAEAPILLRSNVVLRGAGVGATTLKLKDGGVGADLISTPNFNALTGTNSSGGETKWELEYLTLDGNGANQSGTSWAFRVYAYNYRVDNVEITNGKTGNVFSEWGNAAGGDMESFWSRFKIRTPTAAAAVNVDWRGPHDTAFTDGEVVAGTSNLNQVGIWTRGNAGAEAFNNVHVWGFHSIGWQLDHSCLAVNCTAEGALINLKPTAANVTWHGKIFGTNGSRSNEVGLNIQGVSSSKFDIHWYQFTQASGAIPLALGSGSGGKNFITGTVNGFGANSIVSGTTNATDHVTILNGDSTQNGYVNWPAPPVIQVNSGNAFAIRKPISNGQRFNWDTSSAQERAQVLAGAMSGWYADAAGATLTAKVDGSNGSVQPGTQAGVGAKIYSGAGAPGAITGQADGDLYVRLDGAPGATIYQRRSGAWAADSADVSWANVKNPSYGAIGNGTANDTAAVQAAINAVKNNGGGTVFFPAGVYSVGTLTLPFGVTLRGSGVGGDVFYTDLGFPRAPGTILKLQNNINGDLIKTENFDALTGNSTPNTYSVPSRFGLQDLVLDGNYGSQTAGIGLRMYGRSYTLNNVIVQNCKSGGVYSEWITGGYDMEASWSNVRIYDCGGIGLEWRGPHDSQFENVVIGHPLAGATHGIRLVRGAYVGGEQFTNVHVWGTYTTAVWEIGTTNGFFSNCTSDGNGIVLTDNGNTWHGTIYGTQTPGQYAVKLGDGTAIGVSRNHVSGRVFGLKASPYIIQTLNTTSSNNRFEASANLGGYGGITDAYGAKGNVYITTALVAAGATTVPLSGTADLPASGTLYVDDGTNRTAALAYTGKTSNSLTGVSGVPAGGLASGAAVWLRSAYSGTSDLGRDSFELYDYDNPFLPGKLLIRPTDASQGSHQAVWRYDGQLFATEGIQLAGANAAPGGRILGGSGVPTLSATDGDIFIRTDGGASSTIYQRRSGAWVATGA